MSAAPSVVLLVACALCFGTSHASDSDFEAFLKWFNQRGGEAPQLRLANFDGMGTGLLAVQHVHESDAVITVPLTSVACRETILKSASPRVTAALEAVQDDGQLLGTFLVQQFALGENSDWYPYLRVLPKNIPLPFTLSDGELNEFQDVSAAGLARRLRTRVARDFDEVKPLIVLLLQDSGLSSSQIETIPIQELYIRAITLIDSRALTIQGKKYLVPMADMFNYSPHSEMRTADRGNHFLKYHILGKDSFTVLADREAAPGEQLFEDYGDNDNSVYAQHHGFVAVNNPFECVVPKLPPLKTSDKRLSDKKKLSEILRLSSNQQACLKPGPVDALPRSVLDWLYIVNMTPTGVQRCQRILDGERTRGALDECLGDPYSVSSLERLQVALKEQASGFSTSVSFDQGLLEDSRLTDGRRLAVSYRLSRKQALQGVIDSVDKYLKGLGEAKKKAKGGKSSSVAAPPSHSTDRLAAIVKEFNEWFLASNPPVAKIQAVLAPDGMRLGTNTVTDVAAEEIYLSVPTSVIMDVSSAFKSGVAPLLHELRKRFNNGDAFHELLFHLMYETFQLPKMGQVSHWKPYIDTLPTAAELDFPVFYSADELKELQASVSKVTIEKYQGEIKNKFGRIQKLLREFPGYLDEDVFSYENYRWAHAILDSRAIWWGGERHLVPMLDLINCVEGPDPARVHSTVLDPSGNYAITRAPWAFKAGEQLFENYGQPNHIYFSYHGFVLDNNTHDCVVLPLGVSPVDRSEVQQAVDSRLKAANFRPTYNPCLTATSFKPSDLEYVSVAHGVPETDAVKELAAIARRRLAAYPTTAAQDEALLRQGGKSWRFTMSTKLRLSEKRQLERIAALDTSKEDGHGEL